MDTLADIVNTTLSQAEESLKLASARDARPAGGDPLAFLDAELVKSAADDDDRPDRPPFGKNEDDKKDKKSKKDDDDADKKASVISDAEFGLKLADALTVGADILSAKFASDRSPLDAPGPQVHESGMQHASTVPRASSKVTDRITGPSVQGPNGLPTNKADFTSTGDESGRAKNHPGKTAAWTRSKEASARLLRAKTAEAEVLMNLGQIEAAEAILADVNAKLAQDPSSPQPSLGAQSANPGKLDTEPGPSTTIPDNAGLISMNKAQAKDRAVREVSQYISETPKKDNAVPATQLRSDGQKLSHLVLPAFRKAAGDESDDTDTDAKAKDKKDDKKKDGDKEASFDPALGRAYLTKLLKTASDPEASEAERTKAASALRAVKAKLGMDPDALLA